MEKKHKMVLALFQRDINCYAALSGRCRPPRLARPHGRAVPRGGRQADAPSSAAAALLLRRRQRAATRAFNKYPSVEAIGQKAAWAAEAGHEGLWGLTGLACLLQGARAGPASPWSVSRPVRRVTPGAAPGHDQAKIDGGVAWRDGTRAGHGPTKDAKLLGLLTCSLTEWHTPQPVPRAPALPRPTRSRQRRGGVEATGRQESRAPRHVERRTEGDAGRLDSSRWRRLAITPRLTPL